LEGDPIQLQQMLTNLVLNAVEAIGGAPGSVRLELREVLVGDEFHAVGGRPIRPGRYVGFAVYDEGGGIASEILPRIFEPFFTTKAPGRGLGLPAAAGIARAHGGWISVESQLGAGSIFRVLLPVAGVAEGQTA
jgi:signal transduction histidine kinase